MGFLTKNIQYATVTKIRTIYGRRLRDSDYQELMSKKSVSEVTTYLKNNTYYGKPLANVDPSLIHRGYLELILRRNLFESYEEFCKFQRLDKDRFFRFHIVYNEIQELLRCILYMNSKANRDYIASTPTYLLEHAAFPIMALAKATSFQEILTVIRNTPYYELLKDISVTPDGYVDHPSCELRLRTFYLKQLFEIAQNDFHGAEKTALTNQIQTQTDLINIINAYRMKRFFNASAEELNHAMLPFYGRLPQKRIQALYEAANLETFLHEFSNTLYGKQVTDLMQTEKDGHFERELTILRCNVARRSLTFSEGAAVSLYSMMYLLEVEMKNIITIVEGIRYQKSVSYIEKLLILH